jgi:hypothetical protein
VPVDRASCTTSCAPGSVAVKDFSISSALPARSAASAIGRVLRVRGRHVEHVDVGIGQHLA